MLQASESQGARFLPFLLPMKKCLFLLLPLVLFGCRQPSQKSPAALNKFHDETLRTLYTLQDERNTAQLLPYFKHQNALYRETAALAFASVQDRTAIPNLATLLEDPEDRVRKAAAYALGQTADSTAENFLIAVLNRETDKTTRAQMFEALGKVATKIGVEVLTRYDTPDSVFQAGQAWGLYRAQLKGLDLEKAYPKLISFLAPTYSDQVRIAAASTLARNGKVNLTAFTNHVWQRSNRDVMMQYVFPLLEAAKNDKIPEVRAGTATALGKIRQSETMLVLRELIENDPDYRVRIAAIRATKDLDIHYVGNALNKALTDPHPLVRLTAAELKRTFSENIEQVELYPAQQTDWRTRAFLLGTVFKMSLNPARRMPEFLKYYSNARSDYEKGALLLALSNGVHSFAFLQNETFNAKSPVISTYGIEALSNLRRNPLFPDSLKAPFTQMLQKAVASGDVALVGTAAALLREPELNFRQTLTSFDFLKDAQNKLKLPRDVETYLELQKTLAFLEEKPTPEPPKTPAANAIDWNLVQSLPKDQKVRLKTTQGDLVFRLQVEKAPGSVANFVKLVNQGFYNGLSFHRVVPNFVAQGGDPRGDGWGGTEQTIRSEFADLPYEEGSVGLASAGKDTETCQWFITHSRVPHLDGRYSVFAEVVSGREVIHRLNIGDKILKAELVK